MEKSKKILTPEEETELRKSLTDLGMSEEEVNSWIEKSMKEEETGKEETIEEKAEGKGGKEVEENREKNEDDDEEELSNDIEKGSGEGSRGGKVIGHTKSGNPIYDTFDHSEHKNFTKEDHRDAADIHEQYYEKKGRDYMNYGGSEKKRKIVQGHHESMTRHREAADMTPDGSRFHKDDRERENSKKEYKEIYDSYKDDEEEMEKSMSDDELIEKCNGLKMKKSMLEKSINRIETKLGIKGGEDLKKSIDEDIIKSIEAGITNKIEERINDIQKSIEESVVSKLDEKYKGLNAEEIRSDIEKSLSDQLKDIKEEVKKIGDTPIGRKAIITNGANFFEKGNLDDLSDEEKEGKKLSITKDRDEIIKSMQDMFDKSTDNDEKAILQDGITDITVNKSPTNHGIRALGLMLRKKNITLEQ